MWWEFWHWFNNWEWWFGTYQWLEQNNLWKATVAWSIGLALNSVWAVRLWARKKKQDKLRHEALMDKLNTETPGGLGELKRLLTPESAAEDDDEDSDTDDNGTDHHTVNQTHSGWWSPVRGGDPGAGHR